ncbi:hypothetical protein J6590_005531 [Homalodisca vitripennis]|nr:hypothetical protein J6590_005531 [Homalodisca vitripennis]
MSTGDVYLSPWQHLPITLCGVEIISINLHLAKKPSLKLRIGTNGLEVTSDQPPMAEQAGRLQGQDHSASKLRDNPGGIRKRVRLTADMFCNGYVKQDSSVLQAWTSVHHLQGSCLIGLTSQ